MSEMNSASQRSSLNYVIIAIVFLAVGGVMGYSLRPATATASSEAVNASDLRAIVRDELSLALASLPTPAPASAIDSASTGDGSSLTAEDVRAIVQSAIQSAGSVDRFALVDDDPYLGTEDAPIVIVEFSAYACPYCARHFQQTFVPLLENYGQYIRYVYRDYPVINPDVSIPAALAAQCASDQGKFWDYHNGLFENQSRLGDEFFRSLASDLALDMDAFNACFDSQTYRQEIDFDYLDGSSNNISGTPAFYINGQFISGAQPYALFERIVLRELEKLGITPESAS